MGSSRSRGSATAKERLRWTPELHDRFVVAVNRLGGPDSKSFFASIVSINYPMHNHHLIMVHKSATSSKNSYI